MSPLRAVDRAAARLPVEHKVAGGFALALLVLGFVGVAIHRSTGLFVETTAEVGSSHRVLRRLEDLVSLVTEAEAASRGYVITGDTSYLEPVERAGAAIERQLREIRRASLMDASQQARLARLDSLLARRLEVTRRTVALRQEGGAAGAISLVRTGVGKALSDSIRAVIDDVERRETERLEERAARERSAARRLRATTTVGFVLAFLLSVLATLVVRRDVAERRRAERAMRRAKEAAEAASRAKSEFLARMSHELRTPLNSVIGFSSVLLKNRAGNLRPQDLTYLERIVAGGRQLLDLINDVLDLSKIEAGRMTVERVPVALDTLLPDIIASFEGQLRDRDVELRAVIPARLAPVAADPARLQQVLVNLLGNAVKFTERGRITVTVVAEDATGRPLRIDVADSGIGIPADRREAVFGAFEQAESTTTRRFGGTGLGLAIARSLCEPMGFRLELAWSEPGRGSVFSVLLAPDAPRLAAAPQGGDAREPAPRPPALIASGEGAGTGA